MRVTIEIDTQDWRLIHDIFGKRELYSPGIKTDIPGGASLVLTGSDCKRALFSLDTMKFALQFGGGVAAGLAANWLYGKISGKASRLRIEWTEVRIDKGEIERVLTEKVEIQCS